MSPTTGQLRHKPRLIVHTGDGKGKSTAAFGLGLRGWAQGWSIGVFQFIKSGKWRTGERLAFEQLAAAHDATGVGGPVEWQCFGPGWTWLRSNNGVDQQSMAREGWEYVSEQLRTCTHGLYILDEFAHVIAKGWLDVDEVVSTLTARPGTQHVVITGRNAPREIIAAADLVTSMTKLKHPFDLGERGQAGIEW
ncbi:cob(I)alamin adenosyltransferase [Propionibacterium cyclohexanicum]|uniref:Cob(I)alamin adenosyltransferase n=1 Tax=Propionibacterium cyclohexanicum TaxID=64702 RepID=A0A1H9U0S5_9ACTN|nr:cob(I)yrinic acid a,c-diamide adenosyltransferase [Propionibacterium cyclohexanicum]SES02757.1 cob(I)alamin adenosyltransferase [Propionibacterium cyclohexanicum]